MKENIANQRKDDSCYSDMIKSIKTHENQRRIATGVPEDAHYNAINLLQESDMRHLVDAIWNRQSCISGSRNMEELILTRWEPFMELSPWNCVLLTKHEAEKHDQQSNPNDIYTEEFVRKIKQKHLAARRHFSSLPAMERHIRKYYVEKPDGKLAMKV